MRRRETLFRSSRQVPTGRDGASTETPSIKLSNANADILGEPDLVAAFSILNNVNAIHAGKEKPAEWRVILLKLVAGVGFEPTTFRL